MITATKVQKEVGVLHNGATVIASQGDIVLAERLTPTELGKFVTWRFDQQGHAYEGHYFEYGTSGATRAEALVLACSDFAQRLSLVHPF